MGGDTPAARAAVIRNVVFDFDGPLCRLYPDGAAARVADRLRREAEAALGPLPAAELAATPDPQRLLLALHGDVPALEPLCTRLETETAGAAAVAPHSEELLDLLAARRLRMAVASNNSAVAVRAHLAGRGRIGVPFFAPEAVVGRDPAGVHRMKPAPDAVRRALRVLGGDPGQTVMIGDSPADLAAARAAGVWFIGYANRPGKAARLAGADLVVHSLREVVEGWDALPAVLAARPGA